MKIVELFNEFVANIQNGKFDFYDIIAAIITLLGLDIIL